MLQMWESIVETRKKRWMFKFFVMVFGISVGRLSQGTERCPFIVFTYFDSSFQASLSVIFSVFLVF